MPSPTWPFTYETSADAIRVEMAHYERQLKGARESLHRCMKTTALHPLRKSFRKSIDRFEAASRAGRMRLRQLGVG